MRGSVSSTWKHSALACRSSLPPRGARVKSSLTDGRASWSRPARGVGWGGTVRELSLDRERLLRMSLAARERYAAHPTWAESMGRISEFLQTLSGARSHEGTCRVGGGLMVNSHSAQRGVE